MNQTTNAGQVERTSYNRATGREEYADGVEIIAGERWQKYGKDRFYPGMGKDGAYIDLETGDVVDLLPRIDSGVDRYELEFDAETGKVELWRYSTDKAKASCANAEDRVIARFPPELFG